MPTQIPVEYVQGTEVLSGKRKMDVDQNESRKRQRREEGENMPTGNYFDQLTAISGMQCWPCDSNSGSSRKVSKGKKTTTYEKKICQTPGCSRVVQARGQCKAHDPKEHHYCKQTGCNASIRKGAYCRSHITEENTPKCAQTCCDVKAIHGIKYCRMHDNRRKKCKVPECPNLVNARGLCKRHDPTYRQCMIDNCKNQARGALRRLCRRHDPMYKKCMRPDCNSQVQSRGFCSSHDPQWKKCKEDYCMSLARARGRCRKHDEIYEEKKKKGEVVVS